MRIRSYSIILSLSLLVACGPPPLSTLQKNQSALTASTPASSPAHIPVNGPKETVSFSYVPDQGFNLQSVNPAELKYIKLVLVGEGLAQSYANDPVEGDSFIPVSAGMTATISNVPLVPGKLRIVTVIGFNADKQLMPAFIGKGFYRSVAGQGNVPLTVSRQGLLTGMTLEAMLTDFPATAAVINYNLLQSLVNELTGFNPATQTFTTDPMSFNFVALAGMIVNQPNSTISQFFNGSYAPPGNVNMTFTTAQGGAFGEDVTLVVNDPKSLPLTITAGSNSPQNRSFQVTPGNWTLTAKKADGTVVATTAVNVAANGQASVGNNPLVLNGLIQRPVITSLSVTGGLPGHTITVNGSGFAAVAADNLVKFGTTTAQVASVSATSLSVIVPAGLTGLQNVTVAVDGQTSNVSAFAITPTLSGMSVSSGPIGSSLTLNGANFSAQTGENVVKFGTTVAEVLTVSPTSLTVTVPPGISGSRNLTVSVGSQTSAQTHAFAVVPTLTELSPANGGSGISVTLTGTGFDSAVAGNNLVKFGVATATLTAVTATSLTVTVPPLSLGSSHAVTVKVGAQTSAETHLFTVKPGITGLSAASGFAGSSLVITGTNFDPQPENNLVQFGNVTVAVTAATATSLTVTVPSLPAGSQSLTVTVSGQTSAPRSFGILPSITSLSASSGQVGQTLTLNGSGFDPVSANNIVKFGSTTATVTAATATSLTVTVPEGAAGTRRVTVTLDGQTNPENHLFSVPITLSSQSASSGPVGSSLILSGSGFDPVLANNIVKFGSTTATVTAASATSLTVTVPNGIAGNQILNISVDDQASTGTPIFAVVPQINTLSATSGSAGSTLTISGSGFETNASQNQVSFGSTPATVLSATATSLTVTVPDLPFGSQSVKVTVGSQTSTDNINFNVSPSISQLSALQGTIGSSLTIVGQSFDPIAANNTVNFGTASAVVTAASATSLTVTVPSLTAGNYTLSVSVGNHASPGVVFGVQPSVTGLSVSNGGVGDTVMITGTGFGTVAASHIVKFGTIQATVSAASSTSLTVTVPPGGNGNKNLSVTLNSLTNPETNLFAIRPVITTLSANNGDSGSALTITGTGFDGTTPANNSVTFGTIPATVVSATATTLTVTVPNLPLGVHPVKVSVDGLQSLQDLSFTTNNVVLTGLSASSGPIGSSLTINGGGFDSVLANNEVRFGDVPALITAATSTSLTVTVPEMLAGQQTLTVSSGGQTRSNLSFGVQPTLTGISASSGNVGASLTISGKGFDPVLASNAVRFGSTLAQVSAASATSLTVTVPSGASGSANITVSAAGQTSTQTQTYEVMPILTGLSLNSGPVGTGLTLSGSGFSSTVINNIVRFGNVQAQVTVATPTSLSVIVPGVNFTPNVAVTVGNRTTSELHPFSVLLSVSGITPTTARIGSSVTISGGGFDDLNLANNIVRFLSNGAPITNVQAQVTAATPTSLTVTVPEGINAGQNVTVSLGAQNINNPPLIRVIPVITSISASSAPTGSSITLTGIGFSSIFENNAVRFGLILATVTAASPGSLTVTVPNLATGTHAVSVQVGSQTSTESIPFTR